jgi:hypothetical protein
MRRASTGVVKEIPELAPLSTAVEKILAYGLVVCLVIEASRVVTFSKDWLNWDVLCGKDETNQTVVCCGFKTV